MPSSCFGFLGDMWDWVGGGFLLGGSQCEQVVGALGFGVFMSHPAQHSDL